MSTTKKTTTKQLHKTTRDEQSSFFHAVKEVRVTARQQITKYDTYIKPHLEEIEKEIADGKTEMSLAAKYGVSYDTWADYRKKHPKFSEAIKRGNVGLDDAVEINFC